MTFIVGRNELRLGVERICVAARVPQDAADPRRSARPRNNAPTALIGAVVCANTFPDYSRCPPVLHAASLISLPHPNEGLGLDKQKHFQELTGVRGGFSSERTEPHDGLRSHIASSHSNLWGRVHAISVIEWL